MKRKLFISILIALLAGQIYAQLEVEGYIKNIDGEPLPGVSVTVKGTVTGTVTDLKGYYKLSNIPTDGTLVYSFLGMLTEEIEVGDKTQIDVTMVDDIKSLDEVVVVGYGSVKRANLTGAVVDIKADELEDLPVGDLSAALDGKLAGVKISSSTGKPGEASVLRIRTESSFGTATEDVLYVIDGVITDAEAFNLLDASEVESISVLKDAAAAVYGARAAGGVVVVKTKRGSEGKPKINYSGSYGIAQATKFPEMLTGGELAGMYNEIYGIYEDLGGYVDDDDYYTQEEINYFNTLPQNNWIDDVLKTATTEKHTVNISGGSEKIKYFTGGSYYKEDGMIDLLDYSRYSLRANVEAQVTKNLTANLGLNYTYHNQMEPNFAGESQSGVLRDTYKQALTAAPWLPISVDGLPVGNYISSNPLALLNSGSYKNGYGNSSGIRAEIQYKIPFIDGLKFHMQYSRSENNGHGKEYAQNYTVYDFATNGHIIDETSTPTAKQYDNDEGLQQSTDYSKNYQLNTSLNYSKKYGLHDISALLVYEQSESESNNYWTRIVRSSTIPGYDYMWAFSNSENAAWTNGAGASESGNLGLIGRFNYGYAQKYLLETTFRYEASQKFHPDNRWGFFPAVSAGYVISEEDFFKDNVTFINFLKARASAGIVGNDNVTAYLWTPTFTADANGPIFGDELTSALEARNGLVYIPSIHWQETHSYNTGIDTRMMNNHVKFSLDFYYRHTYDIFNKRSNIPVIVGLSSSVKPPAENYGEADARGIEIETGYENSVGKFRYNIDVNFSWDKHKELKLFQSPAVEGSWKDDRVNDPSNQPGYKAIGIMRTQQQLDEWMAKYPDYTIDGFPLQLGMIYYEDVRGEQYIDSLTGKIAYLPPDGKITGDDQTIIAKYTSPPFHYGFTLGFSWKGFKVNGTFSGIFGHKVFITKEEHELPDPNSQDITNVFSFWKDYWTPENPNAAYPRPYYFGLDDQVSTFWMRNGHTLRLKSLNVSYNIPRSLSQKIGIPDMRVYFSSQNLWTIINPFKFKDPGISKGYDYPLMRTYNFGINITI